MKVSLESISARNGINFLCPTDRKIYSVGISTEGLAEIKMAQFDGQRPIIATTVDLAGAEYAKQRIQESGLSDQIELQSLNREAFTCSKLQVSICLCIYSKEHSNRICDSCQKRQSGC